MLSFDRYSMQVPPKGTLDKINYPTMAVKGGGAAGTPSAAAENVRVDTAAFGENAEGWLRLSFACGEDGIREGLGRIREELHGA